MNCDILIRGGEVIDPSTQLRGVRDVAVVDGQIAAMAARLDDVAPKHTIDARGLFVVPGLIDLHVHVYPHSPWGLEPDPLCPAGGVTTMLDAGSAGSYSFGAFRRETIDRAQTQILALVNLSCVGLLTGRLGELLDRRDAAVEGVKGAIMLLLPMIGCLHAATRTSTMKSRASDGHAILGELRLAVFRAAVPRAS